LAQGLLSTTSCTFSKNIIMQYWIYLPVLCPVSMFGLRLSHEQLGGLSPTGCCASQCTVNSSTLLGRERDCAASLKEEDRRLASAWSDSTTLVWWIEYLQKLRESENKLFTFVQVGSYGPHLDPVASFVKERPSWRGLILEASPSNKQMLDKYFENEIQQGRIVTKQNVVTDKCPEQELKFYVPANQANLSSASWVRGIGQLASDRVAVDSEGWCWHLVPCALLRETIPAQLKKAAGWAEADGLDWLQLDAESFEYEILKGLQFSHQPRLIRFEMIKEGWRNSEQLLNYLWNAGYVTAGSNDVLAVRRDIAEAALNTRQDKKIQFILKIDYRKSIAGFPTPAVSERNKALIDKVTGCAK